MFLALWTLIEIWLHGRMWWEVQGLSLEPLQVQAEDETEASDSTQLS